MARNFTSAGGLLAKLSPTLTTPVDSSPPGSSVQGISQAGILEWAAVSFSRVAQTYTNTLKNENGEPEQLNQNI